MLTELYVPRSIKNPAERARYFDRQVALRDAELKRCARIDRDQRLKKEEATREAESNRRQLTIKRLKLYVARGTGIAPPIIVAQLAADLAAEDMGIQSPRAIEVSPTEGPRNLAAWTFKTDKKHFWIRTELCLHYAARAAAHEVGHLAGRSEERSRVHEELFAKTYLSGITCSGCGRRG